MRRQPGPVILEGGLEGVGPESRGSMKNITPLDPSAVKKALDTSSEDSSSAPEVSMTHTVIALENNVSFSSIDFISLFLQEVNVVQIHKPDPSKEKKSKKEGEEKSEDELPCGQGNPPPTPPWPTDKGQGSEKKKKKKDRKKDKSSTPKVRGYI